MSIQEALSHCCEGLKGVAVGAKDAAVSAAKWFGRTVVVIGHHVADAATKVFEFLKPHLASLKDFVVNNKPLVAVAAGAFAAGVALYALVNRACATKPAVVVAAPEVVPQKV